MKALVVTAALMGGVLLALRTASRASIKPLGAVAAKIVADRNLRRLSTKGTPEDSHQEINIVGHSHKWFNLYPDREEAERWRSKVEAYFSDDDEVWYDVVTIDYFYTTDGNIRSGLEKWWSKRTPDEKVALIACYALKAWRYMNSLLPANLRVQIWYGLYVDDKITLDQFYVLCNRGPESLVGTVDAILERACKGHLQKGKLCLTGFLDVVTPAGESNTPKYIKRVYKRYGEVDRIRVDDAVGAEFFALDEKGNMHTCTCRNIHGYIIQLGKHGKSR